MKILTGALLGMIFTAAFFTIKNRIFPRTPEVLASSVSPDRKWLCEVVDIHPSSAVCVMLIHCQPFEGKTHLKRGFHGNCFVTDMDSSTIGPDLRFTWSGSEVTIDGDPRLEPQRLRCETGP
ncbi:MAG: hypothetical protein EOP84_20475 [Verrucomicrobiaceae bacterium]|nr:MAG: hypothetical protein EOP84_20475 [Verrucomicrobiaceae bacterium]